MQKYMVFFLGGDFPYNILIIVHCLGWCQLITPELVGDHLCKDEKGA